MSRGVMYPDGTTLISALIGIYGVFLTVFVGQVPAAVRHRSRELKWFFLAVITIMLGVGVDLIRALISLGDLLGTTLRTLPRNEVIDAEHEAVWWFIVNLVLLAVVFSARSRLTDSSAEPLRGGGRGSSTGLAPSQCATPGPERLAARPITTPQHRQLDLELAHLLVRPVHGRRPKRQPGHQLVGFFRVQGDPTRLKRV